MSECIYWLEDEGKQWCDLGQALCKCMGNDTSCSARGTQVTTALRAERQAATREAMLRAQKKRMHAVIEKHIH